MNLSGANEWRDLTGSMQTTLRAGPRARLGWLRTVGQPISLTSTKECAKANDILTKVIRANSRLSSKQNEALH